MAYNIICNSTFTVQTSVGNIPLSVAISVPLTGSNVVWKTQDLNTAGWSSLDTSSLSDIRYVAATNLGSGSVQISTNSAGTNVIGILQKNDSTIIPWSGSVAAASFYAKAFTSASTLAYVLTES